MGLETPMIFTIMSIILVASSLMAIIIYMISKEYFEDILIETAYYVENSINGRKISLGNKLLTQLLPIILGTLMLIVSILNYLVIYDKGVIQEKLYLEMLKKAEDEEDDDTEQANFNNIIKIDTAIAGGKGVVDLLTKNCNSETDADENSNDDNLK